MLIRFGNTKVLRGQPVQLCVVVLVALILEACSSGVQRTPELGLQQPQFDDVGEKAGSLTVNLSSGAKIDASENLKFSQVQLEETIRRIMEINDLLAEQSDVALPAVEVNVTSVRVRSTFSAMMFGFMAGDDHIEGDVVVWAPDGSKLQAFGVSASYAWGGFAGGDETRMNWLYENFAERMTEELTGRAQEQ